MSSDTASSLNTFTTEAEPAYTVPRPITTFRTITSEKSKKRYNELNSIINRPSSRYSTRDSDDDIYDCLVTAIEELEYEIVDKFLSAYSFLTSCNAVNRETSFGPTALKIYPLAYACQMESLPLMHVLLRHGAKPILPSDNSPTKKYCSPLITILKDSKRPMHEVVHLLVAAIPTPGSTGIYADYMLDVLNFALGPPAKNFCFQVWRYFSPDRLISIKKLKGSIIWNGLY